MSQKFCNILEAWGTIRQFGILLPWLCWWLTTLDRETFSSPDSIRVPLALFASMARSRASKSTLLGLPDFAWSSRSCNQNEISWTIWLLNCDQLCLHLSQKKKNVFGCFHGLIVQFELVLDSVAHLSVRLLSHTRTEAVYNLSMHQLPRYWKL